MSILLEGEKLIEKLHPSRWHFWQIYLAAVLSIVFSLGILFFSTVFWIFGNIKIEGFGDFQIPILFIVILFVLGPLLFGFAELIRLAHLYYITDKRIIEAFNFISRRVVSAQYSRIQNIEMNQSLFERIIGIGDLEIHTAGYAISNRPEISFRGIKNPFQVKKIIVELKMKQNPGSVF